VGVTEADDVLQDACVALLKTARKQAEIPYPKTYAFGVLRHTLWKRYQIYSRRRKAHANLIEALYMPTTTDSYENYIGRVCAELRAIVPHNRQERIGLQIMLAIFEDGKFRSELVEAVGGETVYRLSLSRTLPRVRQTLRKRFEIGTKVTIGSHVVNV
jgi:hypothetical protein